MTLVVVLRYQCVLRVGTFHTLLLLKIAILLGLVELLLLVECNLLLLLLLLHLQLLLLLPLQRWKELPLRLLLPLRPLPSIAPLLLPLPSSMLLLLLLLLNLTTAAPRTHHHIHAATFIMHRALIIFAAVRQDRIRSVHLWNHGSGRCNIIAIHVCLQVHLLRVIGDRHIVLVDRRQHRV